MGELSQPQCSDHWGGGGIRIPTLLRFVHVHVSGGVVSKASEEAVGSVCVTIVTMQQRQQVLHNLSVSVQPYLSSMQSECVILSSLAYSGSTFFPLSHKRHDLNKHGLYTVIFSTIFVRNSSHCKKNLARYYHKCTQVFM